MFFYKIHVRIRYLVLLFLIIFLAIITKVLYIEVISYDRLTKLSNSLHQRILPLMADRGLITDRNGKILADNITTTSLMVVPRQIKNKEEVASKLSAILNTNKKNILKYLNKNSSLERIHPEGRRLSYDIAKKINDLHYDGVYLVKESQRYYPYNNLLAHTIGYVGIDNQGLSGIELQYDDYLKGENGGIYYYSDGKGNLLEKEKSYLSPSAGLSIALTIDLELQLAIENELDNVITKYNADNALIIVENPNNGEILAMASRPSFDANNYQSADTKIINRNLPIWMTYEPGSTFKNVATFTIYIIKNVEK